MSTIVPVICDNRDCGAIWFTESFISIGPGMSVDLTRNSVSPCPECKGSGHIPDGTYTQSSAALVNRADFDLVLGALSALQAKAQAGATSEEIEEEIDKSFPYLSALKRYLPKNAGELAAYLAIIISLFSMHQQNKSNDQPPSINVEVNISQVIQQISKDAPAKKNSLGADDDKSSKNGED